MNGWTRLEGEWVHRPLWKRLINTPLRWLQRGRSRAWLVYSTTTVSGDPPRVLGYGFGPIRMRTDAELEEQRRRTEATVRFVAMDVVEVDP